VQAARGAPLTPSGDPGAPVDPTPAPIEVRRRRVGLLAATAGVALALDIAAKLWVVEHLRDDTRRLLGGRLLLHQSRNPGAAFGIAGGATILFSVIAAGVIAVIARVAPRLVSRGWAIALGLVLGGALGNLVDRVLRDPAPLRGAVVDFIDLRVWPSFNVADSAIVVGGAIAVLLSLRGIEPTATSEPHAEAGDT
jgi:signal peptidase II